jgi:hypothetical protein
LSVDSALVARLTGASLRLHHPDSLSRTGSNFREISLICMHSDVLLKLNDFIDVNHNERNSP